MNDKNYTGCLSEVEDFPTYYWEMIHLMEEMIDGHVDRVRESLKKKAVDHLNITNGMAIHFCRLEEIIGDKKLDYKESIDEMFIFVHWYLSTCSSDGYWDAMMKVFIEKSTLRNPEKLIDE